MHELLEKHAEIFSLALSLELQEEWEESEGRLRTWTRFLGEPLSSGWVLPAAACAPLCMQGAAAGRGGLAVPAVGSS